MKAVYPKPINRQILVKAPITMEEAQGGIIKISEKAAEDKRKDLLLKKFPDYTIKYEVVAVAEDCVNKINPGDIISLSYGGATRPRERVSKGDLELVSEGDIALIWSKEAVEYNFKKYKYEAPVGTII